MHVASDPVAILQNGNERTIALPASGHQGEPHLLSQGRQMRHDVINEPLSCRRPGDGEHSNLLVAHGDGNQSGRTIGI